MYSNDGKYIKSHVRCQRLAPDSSAYFILSILFVYPLLFQQEEDRLRAKEEQERQEEEEYLRLKASFVVEEQGEEDQLTEDQVTSSLPTSCHISCYL